MILYTNGSGHTSGAQCVNPYDTAGEDQPYSPLRDLPHPDNLSASWGPRLAEMLKMSFQTNAKTNATNLDIIDSTRQWIDRHQLASDQVLFVLQWSDWSTDLNYDYELVYGFHEFLDHHGYSNHLFFNGDQSFVDIPDIDRYTWDERYLSPHDDAGSFSGWLTANGYETVLTSDRYFGPAAHAAWAKHLLKHIISHRMI